MKEEGSVIIVHDPKDGFVGPFEGALPPSGLSDMKIEYSYRSPSWRMGSRCPADQNLNSSETQKD